MNFTFLLLLFAGLLSGVIQVLNKKLAGSKHRSSTHAAVIALANGVVGLPFLLYQFRFPESPITWLLIVFSVLAYAISLLFYFIAYKHADVSLVSVVRRLSIVFIAILGVVFLREQLSFVNWLGVVLILLSGVVVAIDKKKIKLSTGVLFALFSAIFASVCSVLDKQILHDISPFTYVVINNLFVGLVLLPRKGVVTDVKDLLKHHWRLIILTAVLMDIGFALVLSVLQATDVSQTMPIYMGLSFMMPVVFGIVLLKEKQKLRQKIVAIVLGLLGIFLLQ